ncbi:hypothetical protein AQI88_20045 [Streptomyces cellostaticus]|uniref:Proteinase inhibitor I42 chagasin domain-containing protein n=1 Tax=Streptomyces cellostaticus TaxID=67285 RepID=A0A117PW58_9ACTN|nr:hypothetical protein [Streptomyces cellostaticus]KUM94762.1 hypothetical protein AQI88_20045 [Streptomyces cellostaticus]GHI07504.1 hypothetical protein Scel_58250 [Streptomyces cellostaticus]
MKAAKYATGLMLGLAVTATMVTTTASAAPHSALADHLVLTNSDDGRSVVRSVGEDSEVRLTAYRERGLTYTWSMPTATNARVLGRTVGGTRPAGDAYAVLHADSPGTSTVSAVRQCHADPGHVCPRAIAPWKATIEVR